MHTLDPLNGYLAERNADIKIHENAPLKTNPAPTNLGAHFDSRGFVAIGYGLDLLHNSPNEIAGYFVVANIQYGGQVGLPTSVLQLIRNYQKNPSQQSQLALIQGFPALPDEASADRLLSARLGKSENQLDQILGYHMQESKERAALVSMVYNNPSLVGHGLVNAIQNNDRIEAWFQIRYKSNGGQSRNQGIATRRYAESHLFGLYENGPLTEAEARRVLQFARKHQVKIGAYEGDFSPLKRRDELQTGGSIGEQLSPAIGYLITNFGEGRSIQQLFTAFTLGGDPVQGGDSDDLLLGDTGHDILIGGGGDDLLRGEEGKDVYVYNSGDGNDTILDTDGQGVVVFDHQMLQGGLKKQNESVYKSFDGQVTYEHSGSDLIVNGTLTIKDWQEGQFGIRLKDLPNDPEDPGVGDVGGSGGRTEFLRIDHYVQVGNLPDGTPIYEPVYAPLFDENSNNSNQADPPIDDQPNTIFALGGNDVVTTFAGEDTIDGGEGNDTLNAGGGNDHLYGRAGQDSLAGGTGNDWLYGGAGNEYAEIPVDSVLMRA